VQSRYDVAIVGFGPTGMTLAGLLGRRGVRVLVVEMDLDVFSLPRAAHIDHTGLRTLQELGCLDELLPQMIPNRGLDLVDAELNVLATVPGNQSSVSGLPASMYFYQPTFDRTLARTVAGIRGIDVRRGFTFTSFNVVGEHVTMHCLNDSGAPVTFEASWLIGCDGAASPVREAAGLTLDSLEFDEPWIVIDLIAEADQPPVIDRAIEVCHPVRPYVTNPIPDNRYRAEMKLLPTDDPADLLRPERLREVLSPIYGTIPLSIERNAVYFFHGLVGRQWRSGRVLLAGDAAHQMPPFLGQGMCSGIRDASNLAWKLDRVVKGTAPEELLDTYETERSPHVRTVVSAAVEFGRFVSMQGGTDGRGYEEHFRTGVPGFTLPPLVPGPLVFLVVGRTEMSFGQRVEQWRDGIGVAVCTVDELGAARPEIEEWLARRDADVVVVRPDRYVLATGKNLDDIDTPELRKLLFSYSGQPAMGAPEQYPARK
jgi:3-(3-hydroxy-phenyl)propionate hydroxylase